MIVEFIDGLQHFHFLQNALITAIVIGVVAGAVGCFIILRGMSLMGDAISHAVLPGVALSFILGIDFFIGAIIFMEDDSAKRSLVFALFVTTLAISLSRS